MLQRTWGLLEIALGGGALGLRLAADNSSNAGPIEGMFSIVSLLAELTLTIAGLLLILKKNYVLGVPILLFGLYCLVLAILYMTKNTLPNALAGENTRIPYFVSYGLLIALGAMNLMHRS